MTTPTEARVRLGRRGLLVGLGGTAAAAVAAVPLARTLTARDLPTDGPELPTLPTLPLDRREGGTRVGELTAAHDGAGLSYNGSSPGPLLRLREGDRVEVRFRNATDTDSSLHLHGVPLTAAVDRPLVHLAPGESDTRVFELLPGSAGTYWYHPHAHGDVERQLLAGLAGPVVVDGPLDRLPGLREADDRLVMFTRVGSDVVANGADQPVLTAGSGLVRLRLLNATAGDHLLLAAVREDGSREPLHLIATDGGMIERPQQLDELLLAPGERAEVLLATHTAGAIGLQRLRYSVYGEGGETNDERTLVTVLVPSDRAAPALPRHLLRVEELEPESAVRTRRVVFGAAEDAFTIDGRTFAMDRVDAHATHGTLEIWEVVNDHTSDHPFHLHSHPVQVLDRDGRPEPFRAWRDTVNVPAGSTVRLLVPFREGGVGRTVYHCHIVNHEDLGMMGVLEVHDRR
jgi:FtsP/CotA-like multicopper oxidase with cupredoxin domain